MAALEFEEVKSERTFSEAELQQSAARNPWNEHRKQYRVLLDDQEAAFVTFDICWPDQLSLYELVVCKNLRNKGVGSAIVRFATNLGRNMGKHRLTIRAGQIGDVTKQELSAYYQRRGLIPSPDDPDLFMLDL